MIETSVIKIDTNFPESGKIRQALSVLKAGGLVAFPTETVYGVAVNAKHRKAVERLYAIKERSLKKPFSYVIGDEREIDVQAVGILPAAYRLANKFWPGPLTLVLNGRKDEGIGLRMPRCDFVLELIRCADFLIQCPSANRSGSREPLSAQDVLDDLKGKIDLVLDGGTTALGVASTVVDARKHPFALMRQGYIQKQDIDAIASKKRVLFVCTGNSCRSVMAEWLLKEKLRRAGRNDIEVFSAGVFASLEMKASPETLALLEQEGINARSHRSQPTTATLLKGSDLIFVMQRVHEEAIMRDYPSLRERLYLLKEFSKFNQGSFEVDDPMGKGIGVYKKSFLDIKEAVDRLIDLI